VWLAWAFCVCVAALLAPFGLWPIPPTCVGGSCAFDALSRSPLREQGVWLAWASCVCVAKQTLRTQPLTHHRCPTRSTICRQSMVDRRIGPCGDVIPAPLSRACPYPAAVRAGLRRAATATPASAASSAQIAGLLPARHPESPELLPPVRGGGSASPVSAMVAVGAPGLLCSSEPVWLPALVGL
jgi:hypothetical protein